MSMTSAVPPSRPATATGPVIDMRFNHDLLVDIEDQGLVEKLFLPIKFALFDPDLAAAFEIHEKAASRAKHQSRRAGAFAVALAVVALFGASFELVYRYTVPELVTKVINYASAGAGILSVAIALGGLLFAGAKRGWLANRMVAERLRQFHFQSVVQNLGLIAQATQDDAARETFLSRRSIEFARFHARYARHADAELAELTADEGSAEVWAFPADPTPLAPGPALESLFAAYRELRFVPQLQYVNFVLRKEAGLFSLATQKLASALSVVALSSVLAIFVLHMAYLAGLDGKLAHVAVLWLAIAALAMRTLEEGLQPGREIERCRHYRSALKALIEHYDAAHDPGEKQRVMREMEKLSFDEMVTFLRAGVEAKFVM